MNLDEKLGRVVARYDELQALLATEDKGDAIARMSKEISDLTPVVEAIAELRKARSDLEEAEAMASDPEMRDLAQEEAADLRERVPELEHAVKLLLVPKDEADSRNAILEVRAGTGGDEAALFAGELFRMYERYAALKGWKVEVMDLNETDLGGVKEVVAMVSGRDVFARLKYESGVHRVQRVPETEGGGRIHTSAATVAVLPEAQDVDVQIEDKDLRIDTYRSQGAGGQHVNTTESAVRITHVPTGVVAACQEEKSQHKNKAKALKMLMAKLYEHQREQAVNERAEARRSQVGSGDRSERIRTYNFPQGRVTDHRINLTLYAIDKIMQGEGLDDLVDALTTEDNAAKLAELA
ncbi:peptide chain release factor 1 [Caenispirillum salinarum]|uniref:peptide chain release factor 1 n=1 Tax=Caenispirillum salinarum TaxID=859058 RepID=UPI00384E0B5C